MPRIAIMIPADAYSAATEDAMIAAAEAGTGMLALAAELHEREAHDNGEKCLSFRRILAATVLSELGISPEALSDPIIIAGLQKDMLDYMREQLADREILH